MARDDVSPAARAQQEYEDALGRLDVIDGGRVRPVIHVTAGRLVEMVRGGIEALRNAGVPIYNRGGVLVRPVRIEAPESGAIRRAAGAVTLVAIDADWIRLRLADVA